MSLEVCKGKLLEADSGYKKGASVISIKGEKRFCLVIDRGDEHWGFILDTSGISIEEGKVIKESSDWFWTTFNYIQHGWLKLPADFKLK